ncbi:transketolase family protein, partial [candidate division KSB1 bacterium]|nr:transketolase family protein [candidate division KSB1 bacterium]
TVARALKASELLDKEGVSARVVNMSTLKPIDKDMVIKCAEETGGIVTAEDHNIYGGLGSAVAEVLVKSKPVPMEFVGVKDTFGESGEPDELAEKYGIDQKGIIAGVNRLLARIK